MLPAVSGSTSPAVNRAFTSRFLRVLFGFPSLSFESQETSRPSPSLYPSPCASRTTLAFFPQQCYPLGISKFISCFAGLSSRRRRVQTDVSLPLGKRYSQPRGYLSMPPQAKPFVLDSDKSVPTSSTWRLEVNCIEGAAYRSAQTSIRPPNIGESGIGQIRRTRKAMVEGPARPSQA